MSRRHASDSPLGLKSKLETSRVLDRCDEILRAIYPAKDKPNKPLRLSRLQKTKIDRLLEKLGLLSETCCADFAEKGLRNSPTQLGPQLLTNLIRHATSCCTETAARCHACPLVSFCESGAQSALFAADTKPSAIDLCAGAGSLSRGFAREGFRVRLAVEVDRNAAQSYRVNNPGVPVIEADVRKFALERELLISLRGKITAVIAGPPCQGFSAAGPRKPRARRNFIYLALADIAKAVCARVVLMENVPGLKRVSGVTFTSRILNDFASRGYFGEAIEVDAFDYGVPQHRRRIVFACAHTDVTRFRLDMEKPKSKKRRTVLEALRGLPRPGVGISRRSASRHRVFNHRAMTHSKRVIDKIRQIEPGTGPISYRRLRHDYARTLIAGHRAMPVHPRQHRTITVREAARLQTVPDNFRFLGPHADQPLQVANVVPYLLARAIARALTAALNGSAPVSIDARR